MFTITRLLKAVKDAKANAVPSHEGNTFETYRAILAVQFTDDNELRERNSHHEAMVRPAMVGQRVLEGQMALVNVLIDALELETMDITLPQIRSMLALKKAMATISQDKQEEVMRILSVSAFPTLTNDYKT